ISSSLGAISAVQPDVTWQGTRPLVAWVQTPAHQYGAAGGRSLRYRFVNFPVGGGITTSIRNPGLPAGAGWPSLATIDDTRVALAYTVSQDGSVVGNRNALRAARGTCDGSTCTWEDTGILDPAGRQVRGERPTTAVDADGSVEMLLRGLAYGPDANGNHARPADSLGMRAGTGELLRIPIASFGGAAANSGIQHLSTDGLQHWRPGFAFDA